MKLLDLTPDQIAVPLFGSIWRAPLGDVDFTPLLTGRTGTGKTALTAVFQQHWGAGLDADHLPASWSSTANHNEGLSFVAKDALLVIDDFTPQGNKGEIDKIHRDAERLLRAVGNHAGRGRMRADTSLRPPKSPRGLVVTTGEDLPRGQSLRARLFVLPISPDSLDWDKLTRRQRDAAAGLFAQAMSGYLQWLAGKYGKVRREMPRRLVELPEQARDGNQHKRTPDIVASLFYGLELFTEFAVKIALSSGNRAGRDHAGQHLLGATAGQMVPPGRERSC